METIRFLLQRYAKPAWRYRWVALALAWIICLGGWAAVFTIPNQFESSARIFVDTDAVLGPLLRGLAADSATGSQIDVLQRTLLSRPNIETLIAKTDLDLLAPTPAAHESLVKRLQDQIKVRPDTHNLFTLSDRDTDPHRAVNVINQLLAIFVERATGTNRQDMENARRFLDHQIASYEQQLRASERRRAEFRAKNLDFLPGSSGVSAYEEARGRVKTLQFQIADAQLRRDALQKELDTTPAMVATETEGGGGGGGNGQLRAAEQHLRELRLQYTDEHPEVQAQKRLIESLRTNPGQDDAPRAPRPAGPHQRTTPNPIYEQVKTRLIDLDTSIASLQRQLDDSTATRDQMEHDARAQPGVQAEYENLDRDYEVLRKNYEELLSRRESATLAQAADTQADKVKLQVIDPPELPRNPVAPNRALLMSGVLLAGLGGAAAVAVLLSRLDRSFHTVDDLRALGLSVLGGISLQRAVVQRRGYPALIGFSAGVLALCLIYGGLILRVSHVGRPI